MPDSPQLNALVLNSLLNLGGQQGGAGSQGRNVGDAYVLPLTTQLPAVPEKFHPVQRPELREALAAAGQAAVQIALIPPVSSRRVIEELMPQLPGGNRRRPEHRPHARHFLGGLGDRSLTVNPSPVDQIARRRCREALRAKWLDGLKLAGRTKRNPASAAGVRKDRRHADARAVG